MSAVGVNAWRGARRHFGARAPALVAALVLAAAGPVPGWAAATGPVATADATPSMGTRAADGHRTEGAETPTNDADDLASATVAPGKGTGPGQRWRWRRVAELEAESLSERRLSRARPSAQSEWQALLRVGAAYRPASGPRLLGEAELVGRLERERGEPEARGAALRINQAYALWEAADDIELRLGRWLQRDEREWLFDENLDGLRLDGERGDWRWQALAARVNLLPRGAFDAHRKGPRDLAAGLLLRHAWRADWTLGGYALVRDRQEAVGERFALAGLRSQGEAPRDGGWQHWTELAISHGRAADGRRIQGWAYDVGGVWRLDALPARLRLIVGHSQASGDAGDAGRDTRFRPSGLESVEAALGSRIKRKLYGEALAPTLSNLRIDSLGLGLDVGRAASVDLVLHRYAQREAGPLQGTGLRPAHDGGGSRRLGHGLDLLLGARPGPDVQLEIVLAWFRPDARFRDRPASEPDPGDAPTAMLARMTLEWRF